MTEIKLTKRYPQSRTEDITDAFMRGYEIGKEQEHRWWSAFCANRKTEPTQNQHIQSVESVESVGEDRKTENSSEKPNNLERSSE